jgi:hypothetical protein
LEKIIQNIYKLLSVINLISNFKLLIPPEINSDVHQLLPPISRLKITIKYMTFIGTKGSRVTNVKKLESRLVNHKWNDKTSFIHFFEYILLHHYFNKH